MIYGEKLITTSCPESFAFRSPRSEDDQELVDYLKVVCGETIFLYKYPEEVTLNEEQEAEFINGSERNFMILVISDKGEIVGSASVNEVGRVFKWSHRCEFGISLGGESTAV